MSEAPLWHRFAKQISALYRSRTGTDQPDNLEDDRATLTAQITYRHGIDCQSLLSLVAWQCYQSAQMLKAVKPLLVTGRVGNVDILQARSKISHSRSVKKAG